MPKSLTHPDAFIFDLDGVIIDSEPLHERATRAACTLHNIELSDGFFDAVRGQTDRDIMEHLAKEAPVGASQLLAAKHDAYDSFQDELMLVPGVLDFLRALAERELPLALVTSSVRQNQERTFERFGLRSYFDVVITAEDVAEAKPHPEPYERAVRTLDVEASACCVIEDSTNGVLSAQRAGCLVVGLCSSFPASALQAAGAHQTVNGFDELVRHLGIAPA